jgi:adenylyltransferase/sulfurtransferase
MSQQNLSAAESARYARHLILPEVGLAGQHKLKAASVLLIGAGGLGSPAALYLAAAGVGRIGLVDPDQVELSNLQRQILHGEAMVGKSKLLSAATRLADINPHVVVEAHPERFSPDNAARIASPYDLILDGSDNFPTRFLSNDIAFFLRKPNIYGALFRFEGQLSVFAPHLGGPCFRCMLPAIPPAGSAPSCAEAGVLGVLPGIIGSLQAMEAIKLLLGVGEPPLGRLVCYDALQTSFRGIRLRRDPACALCGDAPSILSPDNQETRSELACAASGVAIPTVEVREFNRRMAAPLAPFLIDVREPEEHAATHIPGSTLIPLGSLAARLDEIPNTQEIFLHCRSGMRSAQGAALLLECGFPRVSHLAGGIEAWLRDR